MATVKQRIAKLEVAKQNASGQQPAHVCIYDPKTGEPLKPIPQAAKVVIWIPDNNRDKMF